MMCSKLYIFNDGNHHIFCQDFTNIFSHVLSKDEYLAIFHF